MTTLADAYRELLTCAAWGSVANGTAVLRSDGDWDALHLRGKRFTEPLKLPCTCEHHHLTIQAQGVLGVFVLSPMEVLVAARINWTTPETDSYGLFAQSIIKMDAGGEATVTTLGKRERPEGEAAADYLLYVCAWLQDKAPIVAQLVSEGNTVTPGLSHLLLQRTCHYVMGTPRDL